jgi:predicted MFS family arabinose efflux permease
VTQQVRSPWRAVVSLGLGAFIIVAAEFLPIGMLPDIAEDVHVSLGWASLIVLLPGLVAGLSASVIVTLVRGLDRRWLVLGLMTLLVLSNVVSWLAPGFGVLLVARVLVGLTLGGFWAVGPSLSARLIPDRARSATAVVLAGISAGTVVALPVGQAVALIAGWRTVFLGAAIVGVVVLLLQVAWLPSVRSGARVTVAQLADVVRTRGSRAVLIVTIVAFTAQLSASTYIGEYLAQVQGLSTAGGSGLLLAYGALGLLGNVVAARIRLALPLLFGITAAALGVVFACMPSALGAAGGAAVLVLLWGLLWGAFPLLLQSWIMSTTDSPEAASAVLVTFLQLSIALGSAVGGVLVTISGLTGTYLVAGVLELVAGGLAASPLLLARLRRAGPAVAD